MGRAVEVSLHFLTREALRLVLFIENLSCPGSVPRCFPGASTGGSQGLAAAERGSSVQSTSRFLRRWFRWGQVVSGGAGLTPFTRAQEPFTSVGPDAPPRPWPHPCSLMSSSEQATAFVYFEKSDAGVKCSYL